MDLQLTARKPNRRDEHYRLGGIEELCLSKVLRRGLDMECEAWGVCRKGDILQMLEFFPITTPGRVSEKLRFALVRTGPRSSQQFG